MSGSAHGVGQFGHAVGFGMASIMVGAVQRGRQAAYESAVERNANAAIASWMRHAAALERKVARLETELAEAHQALWMAYD